MAQLVYAVREEFPYLYACALLKVQQKGGGDPQSFDHQSGIISHLAAGGQAADPAGPAFTSYALGQN